MKNKKLWFYYLYQGLFLNFYYIEKNINYEQNSDIFGPFPNFASAQRNALARCNRLIKTINNSINDIKAAQEDNYKKKKCGVL